MSSFPLKTSVFFRTFVRLGSSLTLYGVSRLGSSLSVLGDLYHSFRVYFPSSPLVSSVFSDYISMGSSFSLRNFIRISSGFSGE